MGRGKDKGDIMSMLPIMAVESPKREVGVEEVGVEEVGVEEVEVEEVEVEEVEVEILDE